MSSIKNTTAQPYQIKAKAKDSNTWISGVLFRIENKYIILSKEYRSISKTKEICDDNLLVEIYATEIDEHTICRNTGLHSAGYEFYESDIIKTEDNQIGIIRYGIYGTHLGFYIEWKSKQAEYYRQELGYWWEALEVTGNIHDTNKEEKQWDA